MPLHSKKSAKSLISDVIIIGILYLYFEPFNIHTAVLSGAFPWIFPIISFLGHHLVKKRLLHRSVCEEHTHLKVSS